MVSSFNLNVVPMDPRPDSRIAGSFPDTLASWSGSDFDWNTLQDMCQIDPATVLVPSDEYPPELTFEYGFGYGRVPTSPCAAFGPVGAAPRLSNSTNDWSSLPSNPNPVLYYSDEEPFLDVTHSQPQLLHQQSSVVYHDVNSDTSGAPELGPVDDLLYSSSQNPESQFVPSNYLTQLDQSGTEETCAVSQKRKRGCKDTVWPELLVLVSSLL